MARRLKHRGQSTQIAVGEVGDPMAFIAITEHVGGPRPDATALYEPPTRHGVRGLLIVARNQPELWQALMHEVGDSGEVTVLLDRRQRDRRQGVQLVEADRRRIERRSLPHIEDDLRLRKYALVRPHYRRPHD